MKTKMMALMMLVLMGWLGGPTLLQAQSGKIDVPEIHLTGLNSFSGKSVFVYYVNGRPGSIGTAGQGLDVAAVLRGPIVAKVTGGKAVIPAQAGVPRSAPDSFWKSFNYILFVVGSDKQNQAAAVSYIDYRQFKNLDREQGQKGRVVVGF